MPARKRALEKWSPWILLAVIIVAWELICRVFQVSDFIFPAPSAIAVSLHQYARPITDHALQTFWSTMAGFALGASRMDVLVKVGLPRSMPYFFASLKVAITLAFVGSVVSETIASNEGIGYLMMSAGSSMRMPLVFAGLIVISVMAMAMYAVFAFLEKRMTGWATRGMDARA